MTAAYVNVHGQPLNVSARDAVLAILPDAVCKNDRFPHDPMWMVRKSAHRCAAIVGTGKSEESAWRDAWSRMLADDVAREARG